MTCNAKIWSAILLAALMAGCSERSVQHKQPDPDPPSLREAETKLISATNTFCWNLLREVVKEEAANANANVFISPLSASMALGMTLNGARFETEEAMKTALGFSELSREEINAVYRQMLERFAEQDQDVTFQVSNAIWHDDDIVIRDDFISVNQQYFDATIRALDFSSSEAPEIINGWCRERTHGKIEKIVEKISPNTVMFLMNALYFKGSWTYRFDTAETRPGTFRCGDGSLIECDFMRMTTESLRVFRGDGVLGLEMPYGNGTYRFMALMPQNHDASTDVLLDRMTPANWELWRSRLAYSDEEIGLPKFKFTYEITLSDVLKRMGMSVAFSDYADFRGISELPLAISEVKQKTFVQVDEMGTEAAAVTLVDIHFTCCGPDFRFSRPFVVVIYEEQSGAVLFTGVISKPEFAQPS